MNEKTPLWPAYHTTPKNNKNMQIIFLFLIGNTPGQLEKKIEWHGITPSDNHGSQTLVDNQKKQGIYLSCARYIFWVNWPQTEMRSEKKGHAKMWQFVENSDQW